MRTTWTAEQVRALGVRTDVETAGSILGLSRTQAYVAVKNGTFPVSIIRVGRRYLVPTAPILRLLGIEQDDAATGERETASAATTDDSPPVTSGGPAETTRRRCGTPPRPRGCR